VLCGGSTGASGSSGATGARGRSGSTGDLPSELHRIVLLNSALRLTWQQQFSPYLIHRFSLFEVFYQFNSLVECVKHAP